LLKKDLKKKLNNLLNFFKINKGDNLIIHSNSAGLFQFSLKINVKLINDFHKTILKKIGKNGTLLIPTYNYDFTKTKRYSLKNYSKMGLISNHLLKKNLKNRTMEPIFNHLVFGKLRNKFMEANIHECFGKNSSFDLMLKNNFKILCFCCTPDKITFLHYIEKCSAVKYRYDKIFLGVFQPTKNKSREIRLKYNVGKKSLNYRIKNKNLSTFVKKGLIKKKNFGNFECYLIKAKKLKKIVQEKINISENFLIK
jgi:aminoglycoside 3-N-acetyltransferase